MTRGLRLARALTVVGVTTLLIWPFVVGAGLFIGPTSLAVDRLYRFFARVVLRLGFGSHVRVRGLDNLEPGGSHVLVPHHQSHLDSLAIVIALSDRPIRFVAKKELAKIPLFGWALRASGTVFVTRSDTGRDVRALDRQTSTLESVSVLFYAEGTRSRTGDLGAFKKGAAVFALKSGLSLVPIGIAGSFAIHPRGFEVNPGGPIGVSVGRPIAAKGRTHEDRDALTAELREAVARENEHARKLLHDGG